MMTEETINKLEQRWERALELGVKFYDPETSPDRTIIVLREAAGAEWSPIGCVDEFALNFHAEGEAIRTSVMMAFGEAPHRGTKIRRVGKTAPGDDFVDFIVRFY